MQQKKATCGLLMRGLNTVSTIAMRQNSGRYSRGKSDYTGSFQNGFGESTGYGSATLKDAPPRRAYDIRALYEYAHPINDRFSLTAGAGLGHRVLRDLSRRVDPDEL